MATPRPLSLVKVLAHPGDASLPFSGETVVFLGEIPNMPGHCVVADPGTGRIHSGWHTQRFVELEPD